MLEPVVRSHAAALLAMLTGVGCSSGSAGLRAKTDAPAPAQTPADDDRTDDPPGPALTREEIRLVVRSKLPEVRACFTAGLSRAPQLRGRVLLHFVIDPAGKARDVFVSEDQLGEPEVAACLVERIPGWQFPRPRGGQTIEVAYPFAFSSEDSLRAAGLPRVEGTVKPEAVGAVFDARRSELDACVPDQGRGEIGVAFNIDDSGAVTRISSYADSLPDDAGACVLRTVSSWVFPPAASDDEARVNHDLDW